MEALWTALITGGLSLAGVIITNIASNLKIEHRLEVAQAVTDTKLESLTAEVRLHNNFASKIPIIETEIDHLKKDVAELKA